MENKKYTFKVLKFILLLSLFLWKVVNLKTLKQFPNTLVFVDPLSLIFEEIF